MQTDYLLRPATRSRTLPDALSPETLLRLAPGVRTRFDAAGHVLLDAPDGTVVDVGPRGYTAMALFAQPLALGEAVERLEREAPSTDFAPTMNLVSVLIEEGALVRPDAEPGSASGWADPVQPVDETYNLVVEDSSDPADLALLEEQVAAAAIAAAGLGDDQEFALFVRDDEGRVVAGISGIAWGECCELQAMWVDELLRGRGLARALMAGAEAEAGRRGCRLVHFRAYDLLAPGLYERLGYETVGVIEGCPSGSTARWYRKNLELRTG
jgi:GNAT superfamily N-acetyltransferase